MLLAKGAHRLIWNPENIPVAGPHATSVKLEGGEGAWDSVFLKSSTKQFLMCSLG